MDTQPILVPVDFSACSLTALRVAADLARGRSTSLELLFVLRPPIMFSSGGYGMEAKLLNPPLPDDAWRELKELAAAYCDCHVTTCVMSGRVEDAIVQRARVIGAAFIVLGSHVRGGLGRLMSSSTTEEVMRRAPCPVVAVGTSPRCAQEQPAPEPEAARPTSVRLMF